jgi:hypothetical protein
MTTQQAPANPFAPPGQFSAPQQQYQQPAQPQMPPAGQPYQSIDLGPDRWKSLHGDMKSTVLAIAALVGTRFALSDEEQNDGALSNQDLMINEDGTSDMDFEESSMETLGKIMVRAKELYDVADRFRYGLFIREHPTESTAPQQ